MPGHEPKRDRNESGKESQENERSLEEDLRAETVKWQKKAQELYGQISGDESSWRTSPPTFATASIFWRKEISSELLRL